MTTDQRGFNSDNMSDEEKRRIQSEGGKASHSGGRKSGEDTQEESQSSGQGQQSGRTFEDRDQASEAGREGGKNSHGGER